MTSTTPQFETIEFDDFEEIDEDGAKKPDDLMSVLWSLASKVEFKLLLFLFLIFLFITSDVFIDKFLSRFGNSVENRYPNTKGTVIQGLFLILFYLSVNVVVKMGYI